MHVRILGERETYALLTPELAIAAMERAFRCAGRGDAVVPPRIIAWMPDERGGIAAMPAFLGDPNVLAAKLITVFPQNRRAGIESHQGVVVLHETGHGRLLAIAHAGAITAVRTAAVSALATRILSREDAGVLALLGSGTQARMHLQAIAAVRPLREVRVWSRTFENAQTFAREQAAQHAFAVIAVRTAYAAVEGADIVCTVTSATSPVLEGAWLTPGTHVNAVGASVPPFRELDVQTVVRSRVFADSRDAVLRENDDIRVPIAQGAITQSHIIGELSALLEGTVRGRTGAQEITLFKSVGLAIEDAAAITALHEQAIAENKGTLLEF